MVRSVGNKFVYKERSSPMLVIPIGVWWTMFCEGKEVVMPLEHYIGPAAAAAAGLGEWSMS